jgi:hypothetical protein
MDTSSLSILYIIISLASFLLFAKGLHLSLWSMLLTLDQTTQWPKEKGQKDK